MVEDGITVNLAKVDRLKWSKEMDRAERLKYQKKYQREYLQLKRAGFNKSFRDKGEWHVGCSKCRVSVIGGKPQHDPKCPKANNVE